MLICRGFGPKRDHRLALLTSPSSADVLSAVSAPSHIAWATIHHGDKSTITCPSCPRKTALPKKTHIKADGFKFNRARPRGGTALYFVCAFGCFPHRSAVRVALIFFLLSLHLPSFFCCMGTDLESHKICILQCVYNAATIVRRSEAKKKG